MQEIFIHAETVAHLEEVGIASEFFPIYEIGRTLHVRPGELVLLEHPQKKFVLEATILFVREILDKNTQLVVFQAEE